MIKLWISQFILEVWGLESPKWVCCHQVSYWPSGNHQIEDCSLGTSAPVINGEKRIVTQIPIDPW